MDSDRERRIRERAYEIWVREGRPHGRDEQHWQQAEAEIATAEDAVVGAEAADRAAPVRSRRVPRKPEPAAGPGEPAPTRGRGRRSAAP